MVAGFANVGSDPAISIPVGITVGLLASFVQSLGITIQRKSHVLNQELPESEQRVEHRRPLWLVGFTIFISSNVLGSVFQIASLPVVILAPLGAVSLLWNALFARFILGDLFSKFMVLGTLLIVAGAVLIARFGIVPEPTHSLEDLLLLFQRDAFVIYFALLGAVLLIGLIVTHVLEWSLYRKIALEPKGFMSPDSTRASSPIPMTPSPHPFSEPTERTPLLAGDPKAASTPSLLHNTSPLQKYKATVSLIAVSYASASGVISGMCLLFAKSGVELLMLSLSGKNQFWRWESWALVGGLVVFALLQLWYLHKSLILADPTLVCPLAFCFYNVSSIFNGLIYYNQLDELTPLHLGLVILGIVVLLAGVWSVSIQTDEDEDVQGGVKQGDWIPADEQGVAPAVAPADVVRVAERVTGTEPHRDSIIVGPLTITQDAATESEAGSPTHLRDSSLTWAAPPESPESPTRYHRRGRSGTTPGIPPISPPQPRPRFSLLSPDPSTPVIPGFSIGISAASPGFIGGTRRRSDIPTVNTTYRRSVSESGGFSTEPPGSPSERVHRRSSSVDDVFGNGESTASTKVDEEPGEGFGAPGRWVWRLVGWGRHGRANGKEAAREEDSPA